MSLGMVVIMPQEARHATHQQLAILATMAGDVPHLAEQGVVWVGALVDADAGHLHTAHEAVVQVAQLAAVAGLLQLPPCMHGL